MKIRKSRLYQLFAHLFSGTPHDEIDPHAEFLGIG